MALGGMRAFYTGLAALALVGAGAIYLARGSGGGATTVPSLREMAGDTAALPGYVMGSDSAPVEVEEYADFECPACRGFAIVTMPDVAERLVKTGQVRWRFRDFPLYQIHRKSPIAHEAAACAGEQGRFWEMHDQLYYNRDQWVETRNSAKKIREYAQKVGADLSRYDDCMKSHRYQARIAASARQGVERGVNSTPTFVIGNLMIPGALPYDSLKALINGATRNQKP